MKMKLIEYKKALQHRFCKSGGSSSYVERFVIFIHKKTFHFFIFRNFEKTKMVFAQLGF